MTIPVRLGEFEAVPKNSKILGFLLSQLEEKDYRLLKVTSDPDPEAQT